MGRRSYRNQARVTALNAKDEVVGETLLSLDDYYDGSCEVIDSAAYRRKARVRVVKGELYDPKGKMFQSFENQYDSKGAIQHTRVVYSDGERTLT